VSDDQPEIIARPPSHPIATTLLIVSAIGTTLAIVLVWAELFGEYMPTAGPGVPEWKLKEHAPLKYAKEGKPQDYYLKDFPGTDVLKDIQGELGVSTAIGDLSPAPSGDSGGGGAPADGG
jgi:hypothetical protein